MSKQENKAEAQKIINKMIHEESRTYVPSINESKDNKGKYKDFELTKKPKQKRKWSGLSITSFILGIIILFIAFVLPFDSIYPVLTFIIVPSLLAIIFSAIGISGTSTHNKRGKGFAITGLILGIIGFAYFNYLVGVDSVTEDDSYSSFFDGETKTEKYKACMDTAKTLSDNDGGNNKNCSSGSVLCKYINNVSSRKAAINSCESKYGD